DQALAACQHHGAGIARQHRHRLLEAFGRDVLEERRLHGADERKAGIGGLGRGGSRSRTLAESARRDSGEDAMFAWWICRKRVRACTLLLHELETAEIGLIPARPCEHRAQGAERKRIAGPMEVNDGPSTVGVTINPAGSFGPAMLEAVLLERTDQFTNGRISQ